MSSAVCYELKVLLPGITLLPSTDRNSYETATGDEPVRFLVSPSGARQGCGPILAVVVTWHVCRGGRDCLRRRNGFGGSAMTGGRWRLGR